MPQNGVIFSDGVEDDRLDFNSGAIARIGLAERTLSLVVPEHQDRGSVMSELSAPIDHGVRVELAWRGSGGGTDCRSSFSSRCSSCSRRSATARGTVSLSSSG